MDKSPLDHHRRRISELTLQLAALNSADDCSGGNDNKGRDAIADSPGKLPSTADDRDCGRGGADASPARSAESRAERQLDSGLLLKRSELRSMLDFTGECFEEVSSMLRSPRKDPKSVVSLAQVYGRSANSRDGESDGA